jgi:outer membrane protein OmpA-like peptidoglycan-associated protein
MAVVYRICLLFFIFFGIETETMAITRQYKVQLGESQWRVNRSRLECRLHQEIAGYGSAEFRQTGITQPEFKLTAWAGMTPSTTVKTLAIPPAWRWREQQSLLFKQTQLDKGAVLFAGEKANLIAAELARGYFVGFRYHATPGSEVRVEISPENFQKNYQEYSECVGYLLPYTFKDITLSTLDFTEDSHVLSEAVRARLLQLRDYVLADGQVKRVKIDGYSDNLGRRGYNVFLSEQRAKAVRDFLVEKGFPEKIIKLNWHGEEKAIAKNDTDAGRAANRRVVVEILN